MKNKHHHILLVTDDITTTNPELIQKGLDEGWGNSALLKVNQIGTVSEAMDYSCSTTAQHIRPSGHTPVQYILHFVLTGFRSIPESVGTPHLVIINEGSWSDVALAVRVRFRVRSETVDREENCAE